MSRSSMASASRRRTILPSPSLYATNRAPTDRPASTMIPMGSSTLPSSPMTVSAGSLIIAPACHARRTGHPEHPTYPGAPRHNTAQATPSTRTGVAHRTTPQASGTPSTKIIPGDFFGDLHACPGGFPGTFRRLNRQGALALFRTLVWGVYGPTGPDGPVPAAPAQPWTRQLGATGRGSRRCASSGGAGGAEGRERSFFARSTALGTVSAPPLTWRSTLLRLIPAASPAATRRPLATPEELAAYLVVPLATLCA